MSDPLSDNTLYYSFSKSGKENKTIYISEPFLKRPFDFILSFIGIILTLPLWLTIAIAIKLEDGGPVFYVQERWGKNKKKIKVCKFRTMVLNADQKWKHLDVGDDDPRITKVGKILRVMALDELPQLLSICKGDMSLVGPRALPINAKVNELDSDLPDYQIPGFELRSSVRPGLTGIMQIYAPKYISRRNKFKYDIIYIRNQSMLMDFKLILLSFWITLRGQWENANKKV
ncbi:sugar transferase [Desulfobacterota bacterium AH_259_B03_O07]|nr:sugar transferase [Desulfobacterota bacterium AH_259_B03_O07]